MSLFDWLTPRAKKDVVTIKVVNLKKGGQQAIIRLAATGQIIRATKVYRDGAARVAVDWAESQGYRVARRKK